jgi:hypothetical protein
LVIIFLLVVNIEARPAGHSKSLVPLSTFDIRLQAVSWKAFDVDCLAGDTLSGSFKLTNDGDLFMGDQTKYDYWLLGGIDFLIMNETTFDEWNRGIPIDAQYERISITELSWNFEVPAAGKWYVIYVNHSIYIKQIEGDITHTSTSDLALPIIIISLAATLVLLGYCLINKKRKGCGDNGHSILKLFFRCGSFFTSFRFRLRRLCTSGS